MDCLNKPLQSCVAFRMLPLSHFLCTSVPTILQSLCHGVEGLLNAVVLAKYISRISHGLQIQVEIVHGSKGIEDHSCKTAVNSHGCTTAILHWETVSEMKSSIDCQMHIHISLWNKTSNTLIKKTIIQWRLKISHFILLK